MGTDIKSGDRHNRWGQTNTKPDSEWSIFHKKNLDGIYGIRVRVLRLDPKYKQFWEKHARFEIIVTEK